MHTQACLPFVRSGYFQSMPIRYCLLEKKKEVHSLAFPIIAQHLRRPPLTCAWLDCSCNPQIHQLCCHILQLLIQSHVVPPHGRPVGGSSSPFWSTWSREHVCSALEFKSWPGSSSVTPFPTPPTISYTCQYSGIFCLSPATILSLGRLGPWM